MFDGFELDPVRIDSDSGEHGENRLGIPTKSPVAIEQGDKGPVRGIPMTSGVVPSARIEKRNRRERIRDDLNIGWFYPRMAKAELGG